MTRQPDYYANAYADGRRATMFRDRGTVEDLARVFGDRVFLVRIYLKAKDGR